MTLSNPLLIVDDEQPIISGYRMVLGDNGITNLVCCTDSREARQEIMRRKFDLVLLDLTMPHVSGEELLSDIAKWQPGVPAIVVTGKQEVDTAVACMKKGAHDYLVKPVPAERVLTAVRNALRLRELQRENERLSDAFFTSEPKCSEHFTGIITRNAAMKTVFQYVEAVAPTPYPVLLTGETGVGKELVARAVHKASGRKGAFVAVNVAGLDDNLFSDTLFGHRKGAFTGAEKARAGAVESAAGGTLFMDEIGDLSVPSQVKLLRLLQESEYVPLGQDAPISTDARFVVATNADLDQRQREGRFRADLYYRLNMHRVRLPPLRDRLDDLPLLVDHFLERVSANLKKKRPTPPRELIRLLSTHAFPGNIRELDAMITEAVSRHTSGMLSLQSFKEHIDSAGGGAGGAPGMPSQSAGFFGEELPQLDEVKHLLIEEAMRRAGGNQSRAAEMLGSSRQAVMWHLRKHSGGEEGK